MTTIARWADGTLVHPSEEVVGFIDLVAERTDPMAPGTHYLCLGCGCAYEVGENLAPTCDGTCRCHACAECGAEDEKHTVHCTLFDSVVDR